MLDITNVHFRYYDVVLIFNLLNFKVEEILFGDAKINNNIIIQIATQGRLNY